MPTARHEKSAENTADKREEKRHAMANEADNIDASENDNEEVDERPSQRGGSRSRSTGSSGRENTRRDSRSFGSMISQSLAEESQQGVDRVLGELREGLEVAREYVSENPREAAGLAICAGAVAWALLGTKPGRKVFEAGAAIAVPYATKWVARNMADALR